SMAVKPLMVEVSYPVLNIPGNYQGWDPASPLTVIHSLKSDEVYDGYVYFGEAATMFKFAKGSWDNNWGDDGVDGTLEPGGADIAATGPAMYRLSADLNTLTYTAIQTDWGLIGSATPDGWDADQDLTYNAEAGILTITLDLVEGEVKFRANDDWGLNLGDDHANGVMEYDGANIIIDAAGNYTITLDLSGALILYTLTKN
ncbi:MAG: SusF/SusE family outer membrane protein, partial [Bacteroidales bacterium]|nr:SusF/SusE family outer membrane protein [Bacteroidales bacterium]